MNVTQKAFCTAVFAPKAQVPEGLVDANGDQAGRRFDVYRNNVAVSLTEALHEGFPVLTKLIGTDNMNGLAGLFLRAHPPTSPVLQQYGAALPEFVAGLPQLAHLGYLPDVARLELALRRSYHAADAAPVDTARLDAIASQALMGARITLAPATQILRSPWPVLDIWRFNTQTNAPPPSANAQDVLVTRPDFDPMPQALPIGGAVFINALSDGTTFKAAYETATCEAPDFDPGPSLALLLQGKAITDIQLKD